MSFDCQATVAESSTVPSWRHDFMDKIPTAHFDITGMVDCLGLMLQAPRAEGFR